MSAPRIILAILPPFCQKLSKLVEIWRSSDQNNFAQFFWDTVYYFHLLSKTFHLWRQFYVIVNHAVTWLQLVNINFQSQLSA